MNYVSVTAPGTEMSKVIFNYFDNYLISLGEAATTTGWTMANIINHLNKSIKEKPDDMNLYLDSGGFQIITGYIEKDRIIEYIQAYHIVFEKFMNDITKIFSLDVFNYKLHFNELYNFNKISTLASIELINKKPEAKDKQLYVLQLSNKQSLRIWKKLLFDPEVEAYKYFKLWSIGGLVGLKKTTNAKFSHAVPATLWFLTYQKILNFPIEQMHWLGQSSRLSFLAMGLFKRIYGLTMTSDSSALVRFAPIEQKLPLLHRHDEEDEINCGFNIATEIKDIDIMLNNHSFDSDKFKYDHTYSSDFDRVSAQRIQCGQNKNKISTMFPEEFKTRSEYAKKHIEEYGVLDNSDMTELQAQGIYFEIQLANIVCDKIMEIGIDNINTVNDVRLLHPVMTKGRVASELFNNIKIFKEFAPIIENKDISAADNLLIDVLDSYELNNKVQETQKEVNNIRNYINVIETLEKYINKIKKENNLETSDKKEAWQILNIYKQGQSKDIFIDFQNYIEDKTVDYIITDELEILNNEKIKYSNRLKEKTDDYNKVRDKTKDFRFN